ncbi:hypothetical protein [Streptomyces sp. NPDC059142]|uniref:AtuA-related protein n=1 Tax=Streptomyces sp. NPDC059142 TaxID=3346739 RepID=UPI0036D11059
MQTPTPTVVSLREIAFSRSGDKGDIINVSVIPYRAEHWDIIREQVTVDMVAKLYDGLVTGTITRYELPGTRALNFVMTGALGGGIATSLRVDGHGKSLQSHILEGRVQLDGSAVKPQ